MTISLRARLLLAFLVPTLLLLGGAGFLGYQSSRNVLEEELGRSLAAQAAAVAVSLNAERLLALSPEDAAGEGSRVYRSLNRQLTDARTAIGARRIVAFDLNGIVRLDAGGVLPIGAEMPELLRDRSELQPVFAGQRGFSQVLFEGTDARFYKTGYAPLLVDGRVVGAVAVEGSAEFFRPLQWLFRAYVGLLGLTLLVLAIAAVLSARAVSRPVEQLVESALRIGGGDLSTRVQSQPTREIGILARELEAMRRALESRDRQLKMMLGGVAHEVKNPLGGIELFSGLLAEELDSKPASLDDARSHVEKVRRELNYLKRIVDDFLAFAREQKLNAAPFEARELLEQVKELMSGDAQTRQVTLVVEAEPASVVGDGSLLTSAVVNLVKNAVQASSANQTVTLKGLKRDAHYVFEVWDEGPGVPLESQAHIFEPFFTTREKGTGLGLPLAAKLFEAHRGTLSLESQPGRTVFRGTVLCNET